ncbi:hypothetical protein KC19_2G036500 [Ceratodon purpureus]|uniref:Uncharacterized protein n=1 Tax=Ceratodon purpureus TaxID=3225 RepID=A0A8T0ISK6_CERPU|nr:hypothetical protein KC19_2G036500 [Ceratodon purpureus]
MVNPATRPQNQNRFLSFPSLPFPSLLFSSLPFPFLSSSTFTSQCNNNNTSSYHTDNVKKSSRSSMPTSLDSTILPDAIQAKYCTKSSTKPPKTCRKPFGRCGEYHAKGKKK